MIFIVSHAIRHRWDTYDRTLQNRIRYALATWRPTSEQSSARGIHQRVGLEGL